jgi:hypothetical protein
MLCVFNWRLIWRCWFAINCYADWFIGSYLRTSVYLYWLLKVLNYALDSSITINKFSYCKDSLIRLSALQRMSAEQCQPLCHRVWEPCSHRYIAELSTNESLRVFICLLSSIYSKYEAYVSSAKAKCLFTTVYKWVIYCTCIDEGKIPIHSGPLYTLS